MTTHVHVMYMIGKHIHAHNILIPNTFTLISPPMYMFVQNSEKKRTPIYLHYYLYRFYNPAGQHLQDYSFPAFQICSHNFAVYLL